MPYHRLGEGKYRSLDRPYPLAGLAPLTAEDLAGAQRGLRGLWAGVHDIELTHQEVREQGHDHHD